MISVGIGEYAITNDVNESIVTHALGSCVALIMHCSASKITAMAHVVLPFHSEGMSIESKKDAYYATVIVPRLMDFFIQEQKCKSRDLQIMLVGGASVVKGEDVFNVGQRNVNRIESILKTYDVTYEKTDVLGNCSRTVKIDAGTGAVSIKKQLMFL